MEKFPPALQDKFFQLMLNEIALPEFESWLYKSKELEAFLGEFVYHDLISIDFRERHAMQELLKIAGPYIDYSGFQKLMLLRILDSIIQRDGDFLESVIATYTLRNKGYSFLDPIGMQWGLSLDVEYYEREKWEQLSPEEKESLIKSVHADVLQDALQIKSWLETGLIVPTGIKEEYNRVSFHDYRPESQR